MVANMECLLRVMGLETGWVCRLAVFLGLWEEGAVAVEAAALAGEAGADTGLVADTTAAPVVPGVGMVAMGMEWFEREASGDWGFAAEACRAGDDAGVAAAALTDELAGVASFSPCAVKLSPGLAPVCGVGLG
jgi:hypothetical protein